MKDPNVLIRNCLAGGGAALLGLLSACGKPPGGPPPGMGAPSPVAVITVQPESLPVVFEYAAQMRGAREAEVRSRVAGILERRNYEEGTSVKAGQSLFNIDPAPFQAALERAQADLAAAQARRDQTQREAVRLKPLFEAKAVSQREYDDAVSSEAINAADLQSAQARLKDARRNLEYARVESPISGVASRALVSEGTLVPGPEALLTTVTQTDPMQVLFGISDNDQIKLRQEIQSGQLHWPKGNRFKVTVRLADGSEYARSGVMDFSDVRVNASTGTSEARAALPNPDGVLRSGQFVRVRLEGAVRNNAVKVPQRAILEGPQGKFVFVVDGQNKAGIRPVQIGDWSGQDWIVTHGLNAGDRVVVDGMLKLGPGAPVMIGDSPAKAPTSAAPQSSTAKQ